MNCGREDPARRESAACNLKHGPCIASQLQLLGGQRHALFDLAQRPFVPAARQILIEVFERGLLALRLGQFAFQQAELRLQGRHLILRLLGDDAVLLVGGIAVGQIASPFPAACRPDGGGFRSIASLRVRRYDGDDRPGCATAMRSLPAQAGRSLPASRRALIPRQAAEGKNSRS